MGTIRTILADDHTLLRAGIHSLLDGLPDIDVVAEAADGIEALNLVAAHHPEVVLLDIAMPGLSGLDVAARIARQFPATRVVILTMYHDEEYVRRALISGALGYLVKDSGTEELRMALRAVSRGEVYLSPAVSRHLVADYLRHARDVDDPAGTLTQRQREVLQLIAAGQSTKTIGRMLGISNKTVESHRTQLMERLDIHDVAGLVRYAIRVGLVTADE